MRYFARSHQHVEEAHEVFEDGAQDRLRQQPFDPGALPEVRRAVEQTFEAMTRLGDHSERAIQSLRKERMSA
jgi:hypothetical protein